MARVQVLREYRPTTFSVHFEKQREWARRVVRYKNRPVFEILPPAYGFAKLRYLAKSWGSWRVHYFKRAVGRVIARFCCIVGW